MFQTAQASVVRDRRRILNRVTLALAPGALTVVIGPNGAGKSTLLRVLTGELLPDEGDALLRGRSLARWPENELAAMRTVLPQSSRLSFPFTVHEVVALGARANGLRLAPHLRRALPARALAQVGLGGHAGRFYQTLSGGEQQRVQLARVLCQVPDATHDGLPRWLFLDEPTANLDIEHQLAILDLARAHARAGGGVVAVLHDLNMAALYADRLIVMAEGGVVADGAPADVLDDALIERVFRVALTVNAVPEGPVPFVLPHSATSASARPAIAPAQNR